MDYRFRKFESLGKDELSLWRRLQQAHEHLESPFFRPEYAEIIQRIHGNVEACMLLEKNLPVGFFAWQRTGGSSGMPLGGASNECQGLIAAPTLRPAPVAMLQACGLTAWDFDHVPRSQVWCQSYQNSESRQFVADLKEGFERYAHVLRNRGTLELREAERLEHKLDREVGDLRLAVNDPQEELWQHLLKWKAEHASATSGKNPLANEATSTFFREALKSSDRGFQAVLIGLYAGHQLVAVDAGLRSNHVYHHLWWSHDQHFARFAPSQVLRSRLLKWAASDGIRKVYLGRTSEEYKAALATSELILGKGAITTTLLANLTRQISLNMQRMFPRKAGA